MRDASLTAFQDELEKIGASLHGALSGMGALGGMGGLAGGVGGAALGAYRGYRSAREQGEGVGGSVLRGARAMPMGALAGGAVGALAGTAGGAALGAVRPGAGAYLAGANRGVMGGAARFGQREVHGVTGWTPAEGLRSIRGGAYDAEQNLAKAVSGGRAKDIAAATRGRDAAQAAVDKGVTSLPGVARAVRRDGLLSTAKTLAGDQWHNTTPGMRALGIGVPALGAATELASPDDGHRGERLGRSLGGLAGGVLTGGSMPLVAGAVLGTGLGSLGGHAGHAVDKVRGKVRGHGRVVPPAPDLQAAADVSGPHEVVRSPAAAGQFPEGV